MGTFVELIIACELREDTPQQVIDVLNYMTGQAEEPDQLPDHPFFKIPDLSKGMGILADYPTYYFPGVPHIVFGYFVPNMGNYRLSVRNYIKSNSYKEIQKFLHWIAPYCETNESPTIFIGYMRHESELHPTLIYFGDDGTAYLSKVNVLEPLEL